jgi:hypothetical protein
LVPLAMHWLDASLGAGAGWAEVEEFAGMRARFHLPWWLLAWLVPLAFTAVVALGLVLFESALYALRLDRGDHAWSSLAWSVRGWRAALAWAPVLGALIAILSMLPETPRPGLAILYDLLRSVAWMLLPGLFLLNATYLSAPRPRVLASPRWPGTLPVALQLAAVLVAALSSAFPLRDWPDRSPWLLVVPMLVMAFASLFALLLWLDPRRPKAGAAALDALRSTFQPRVFLPMLVLLLRCVFIFMALLLPLLPVWLLLGGIVPLLAPQFACCWSGPAPWLVHASRFAVMYWWLLLMLSAGLFWMVASVWLAMLSSGRLLVELGAVPTVASTTPEAAG